jgi:hypothetical protein
VPSGATRVEVLVQHQLTCPPVGAVLLVFKGLKPVTARK